jgi:hypothetical protein
MIVFSDTAIIITLIHLKMPFLDTKIKIKKINKSISVGVQFNSSKSQFNQLKVKRRFDYLLSYRYGFVNEIVMLR